MSVMNRLAGRVGTFPVEIPAALLAAGAIAFLTMVAPDWRIERLVGATGVGQVLPAARPPLGETARLLLALLGAALTFALVWSGLRALEPREMLPAGYPAFRAKDLHPDAPRRRPIFAGEEFGTPDVLELDEPMPEGAAVEAAPLPSFLRPVHLSEAEVATEEVEFPNRSAENLGAERDPGFAPEPDLAGLGKAIGAAPGPAEVPVESVPELMARLERGLAVRGPVPVAPAADEDTNAALRAIAAELKQVARGR